MVTATSSARERLLEVAGRLFYAEGIHAVGVDRVIAEANVAKATLYAHFSGKDELVAAYLSERSKGWASEVSRRASDETHDAVARALAPFDLLAERASDPDYRGCPFINAAAEFPGPGRVAEQLVAHRRQVREAFSALVAATGAGDVEALTDEFVVLYDGAMTAAYLDHSSAVVGTARRVAEDLLRSPKSATSRSLVLAEKTETRGRP
ncbi:MAG: TetR/AcrR family transcriptional regulator [Acidimicrobiales bacterium]